MRPRSGRLWFGGDQAFVCDAPVGAGLPDPLLRRPIRVRLAPDALTALASRSHGDAETEAFLEPLPIAERRSRGSSLKFCMIAEGLADVYPRFGPTMEWDTAAGDAVLRAAGGVVLDLTGALSSMEKSAAICATDLSSPGATPPPLAGLAFVNNLLTQVNET